MTRVDVRARSSRVVFRYLGSALMSGIRAAMLSKRVSIGGNRYVIESFLEVARRASPAGAQGTFVAESTIRKLFPVGEDLGVVAPAGLVLSRNLVIVPRP